MRRSKQGSQKPWSEDDLRIGFKKYFDLNNKYPTAGEVDEFEFLPSSRSIQRKFGGLVELRKKLNLEADYRTGEYSTARALLINKRAHKLEKEVLEYLVSIFKKEFVHREYFFTDDRRTRTDFYIYDKKGNFSIDVFYPKDRKSFIGCLNSKMRAYKNVNIEYPVIFLQMNEEITKEKIEDILYRKKNKLQGNQIVMTYSELKSFCSTRA